jgi:hypothetical protein
MKEKLREITIKSSIGEHLTYEESEILRKLEIIETPFLNYEIFNINGENYYFYQESIFLSENNIDYKFKVSSELFYLSYNLLSKYFPEYKIEEIIKYFIQKFINNRENIDIINSNTGAYPLEWRLVELEYANNKRNRNS